MSPSTKNLRERIEESLSNRGINPVALQQITEIHLSLLSSELSLAVKGLREALEEVGTGGNLNGGKADYETGLILGARIAKDSALSVFDSKTKEILGESS